MNLYTLIYRYEQLIPFINDINNEMMEVLSLFIFHQRLSIYQIHKIIEKHVRKMAYMNTHKKVQKLIDLKLIEKETDTSKFSERELEKGAKYYKLSEEGIFVLFYNSNVLFRPSIYYVQRAFDEGKTVEYVSNIFAEYKKEIFKKHKNSVFFELFLFPWISIETIDNADKKILDNVIMSLNECCTIIKDYNLKTSGFYRIDWNVIRHLNSEIMNGNRISGLESVDVDDKNLLPYMQNFFNEGLPKVRIKREDIKNHIILSKPPVPNFHSQKKLLLAYKDEEDRSNIISFYKNSEGSSLFNYSLWHRLISNPLSDIKDGDIDLKSLYFKAVFSIVMGLSKEDNLELLKEDKKFMETLNEIKEKFDSGYELLTS